MMKYDFQLHMDNENSLSLLLNNVSRDAVVLEFGPANGRMTKYMKEELNCKVYLAELDEASGREALQYGVDLCVGDVENYEWLSKYKDISFDHIVFADVLEHLRNPLKVLTCAKGLLKDGGTILVSVPNLAHNSVMIDLLNHKFKYRSTGLLDDTHIHFFTKSSLEEMIAEAGLYPAKKMATYASVGTIEIANSIYDVEQISPCFWKNRPYGDVYQYVYILSKIPVEEVKEPEFGPQNYYLEVFYDKEELWNDLQKDRFPIVSLPGAKTFSIPLEDTYQSVRIDPINASCFIRVCSAKGITDSGMVDLTKKAYNASGCYEAYMLFETEDPVIIFSIPEGVRELELTIDYVELELKNQKTKTEQYTKMLESMHALQAEKQQLQHSLSAQGAELDAWKARWEQLEQSRFYKLYQLLKKQVKNEQ